MVKNTTENIPDSPSAIWERAGGRINDVNRTLERDTDIDALQSYLRSIGDMPLLSAERQKELADAVIEADDSFRREVYVFGMVMLEHIRYLDSACDDSAMVELLLPSTLPPRGEVVAAVKQWKSELSAYHAKWSAAFKRSNVGLDIFRAGAVELLMRFPFSGDLIENFYQLIADYRTLAASDRPGMNHFLEEKFLMSIPEYRARLAAATEARSTLLDLRRQMLEGNLRLVISVANQYHHPNLPRNDLIQEGNLGLMRALEKFDFRLGNRFSTYAIWWIRQNITRAIAEQGGIIRIPGHIINTIRAINQAEQRFILENGVEPSVEQLARVLEMPAPRISAIRKMARQTISLQAPLSSSDGGSIEDLLADENAVEPGNMISGDLLQEKIREILNTLSEREQQIIIMRFGLFEQTPQTLEEVSRHFRLTRERIRQLEVKIIEKLRNPELLKLLEGFFRR